MLIVDEGAFGHFLTGSLNAKRRYNALLDINYDSDSLVSLIIDIVLNSVRLVGIVN